jgi:bacteriorhodopsin
MMFDMNAGQFDLVYNVLSFSLASMAASTMFFWLRVGSVHEKYKSALVISGLVTFIAAYHYIRIFNSWTEAYEFPFGKNGADPVLTGKPFNDAYRYMDWLLTVPLLLLEIIFCMNLSPEQMSSEAWSLGISSALMIAIGYPGELCIAGNLWIRFVCFCFSFAGFLYIVNKLLIGLKGAIAKETNPDVASMLNQVCLATVVSWCPYPVVYLLPFLGIGGAHVVVSIQLGYCASDVISKCGVGFLIYNITIAKSRVLTEEALLPK